MRNTNHTLLFTAVFLSVVGAESLMNNMVASETIKETDNESATSQIRSQPHESLRVKEQKEEGILEKERNYSEKSDWVKNRDRLEGTAQKIGDTIKKLF